MFNKIILVFIATISFQFCFAQPTHTFTDVEKDYKILQQYILDGQYAYAYTLAGKLKNLSPDLYTAPKGYIKDDVAYYYILSELKLQQPRAKEDAVLYLAKTTNGPRVSSLSYQLGHAYFLENNFEEAIKYFDAAGFENLSNEELADAKFEKAYALFNLKRFSEAKPLFNEIHQLEANKYYIPANYYYGFISYYDKDYTEALNAFKIVELYPEYQGVVPYYITEIYYFQGKKDLALSYGESILKRTQQLYYVNQLKLLLGQIYFENKEYSKALPLLEAYVQQNEKVNKEILYELSYSYYVTGKFPQAIAGFKQLSSEKDSMGQNSMYLLGDLYLQTNDKANARSAFQYGAFNSSNQKQQKVSLFNYAKLSYELGYEDVALKEMKNYLNTYPKSEYDTEAKEIMVSLLARTNNFRDALSLYNSFESPTANMQRVLPQIQYGRAIEYLNDQKPADADLLLAKVLADKNAGNLAPFANFWRGEIAYRAGRYNEAIGFLTKYIQQNAPAAGEANSSSAKYSLAYSYLQQENYAQAGQYFEQVASDKSSISAAIATDAYVRAADSYFMRRDFTKANAMYTQVVATGGPQADYAYYQKALIAGVKNSNDKINMLSNLPKQYPGSSLLQDANMEVAIAYIADEKFRNAIPFLNAVIASNAEGLKPRAYLKKGLAYYNDNNNSEALLAYKNLISKYPQSSEADEAVDIIKDIYIEDGNPAAYVALMKENGRIVSVSQADSLTYSAALQRINNNDCPAAISSLQNYLSTYPAGAYRTEANYNLAVCYQKGKDNSNALKYYAAVTNAGLSKYFERSVLEQARIYYFEEKDYVKAKQSFELLLKNAVSQENQLEALRGLVRSNYYLKNYAGAQDAAADLVSRKGINTDDKSVGYLVLGKSQQVAGNCKDAITSFGSAAAINKTAWGAEARYEIANCQFNQQNYKGAEKAALAVIKETGSYDEWVTKSYILLGDIFMQQKDYFNAKATYESVAKNASMDNLRKEAADKLAAAVEAEKRESKIK